MNVLGKEVNGHKNHLIISLRKRKRDPVRPPPVRTRTGAGEGIAPASWGLMAGNWEGEDFHLPGFAKLVPASVHTHTHTL